MDEFPLQPIPWLPVLETGYAEIDKQHRALIDDANTVYRLATRQGNWTDLQAAILKMAHDCAVHFNDEGKLLTESGFADAKAHTIEHQRVLDEIQNIAAIVRSTDAPTRLHWELPLAFRSLLIDHFLRYDLRYKSHLMYFEPRLPGG